MQDLLCKSNDHQPPAPNWRYFPHWREFLLLESNIANIRAILAQHQEGKIASSISDDLICGYLMSAETHCESLLDQIQNPVR